MQIRALTLLTGRQTASLIECSAQLTEVNDGPLREIGLPSYKYAPGYKPIRIFAELYSSRRAVDSSKGRIGAAIRDNIS